MRTLLLFLLSCFNLAAFAQSNDALKYIKDNAVPIDTAIDKADMKDLAFLKETLAGRRVVGMGEATHGTHDFQAAKVRIFKYLVTEMHYTLFAIEANFTKCRKVNEYVLNGKGDPKKAIADLVFWMWDTSDLLDLVEWMHTYNLDKPQDKKVKFYGIDIQYDYYTMPQLSANLKKLDSTYYNTHFASLKKLNLHTTTLNDAQRDSIKNLLTQLKTYVNAQENNLLKILPAEEVAGTKQDVRLLEECLDLNEAKTRIRNRASAYSDIRDKGMCENVQWILNHEGPDSKIAIWAHNFHISKTGTSHGNMGQYLKETFRDGYYALGFDFNKGSFKAINQQLRRIVTFTVPDAQQGSSGQIFSTVGLPEFFIDVNKAVKNDAAKKLFTQKLTHRIAGEGAKDEQEAISTYLKDAIADMYDGLIFVNDTSPIVFNK